MEWFDARSGHVGFVVLSDIRAGFFEYFRFLCQLSSHQLFHIYLPSYHPRYTVSILKASSHKHLLKKFIEFFKKSQNVANVLNTEGLVRIIHYNKQTNKQTKAATRSSSQCILKSVGFEQLSFPLAPLQLCAIPDSLCPRLWRRWLWLLHRTSLTELWIEMNCFHIDYMQARKTHGRTKAWPQAPSTSETDVRIEPLYPQGKRSLCSLDARICGLQGRPGCGEQEEVLLPTEVEPLWSSPRFSIISTGKARYEQKVNLPCLIN
jgi:hypothetical protein